MVSEGYESIMVGRLGREQQACDRSRELRAHILSGKQKPERANQKGQKSSSS